MTEVLLFSDDEKIFNLTNSVIDGRYKLTWCTYKSLEKKLYPYPDIVIMYFDKEMVKKGTFKTIVQVKGRLGQRIPILTLMEEGTPQNIFSTLMAGGYELSLIYKSQPPRRVPNFLAHFRFYKKKSLLNNCRKPRKIKEKRQFERKVKIF